MGTDVLNWFHTDCGQDANEEQHKNKSANKQMAWNDFISDLLKVLDVLQSEEMIGQKMIGAIRQKIPVCLDEEQNVGSFIS